uniref:Uncharacterized protein n=1 Tax=Pararge aegeria TaxID=116150 RepID=S4PBT0_9NEOP
MSNLILTAKIKHTISLITEGASTNSRRDSRENVVFLIGLNIRTYRTTYIYIRWNISVTYKAISLYTG